MAGAFCARLVRSATMLVDLGLPNRRVTPASQPVRRRVALVVMPVHVPEYPSLAVATLAAELRRRGHEVDVYCLNLEAAVAVGLDTYAIIGNENSWVRNVGEWLFSHPNITPGAADAPAFRRFLAERHIEVAFEPFPQVDLEALRATFDGLIARWEEEIPWESYDVVGFTVMFQQLNASLRLAHAVKRRAPGVRIVLGGCTMEHPMGDAIFARYPAIDAVFAGYADRSFPRWVESLPPRAARPISDDGPTDLDELPVPCFDEYVRALRRLGLHGRVASKILVETSRGCWYGEKQHCTFCGMNGLQMRFRQKSVARAFDELQAVARHGLPLQAVDNIVPRNYFDELFPRLDRAGVFLDLFYEIKSNCDRRELETLAKVGIKRLQPGIESLSTSVLRLMKKGVSGIQNVWFLRAAEELDISCQWSVLWGFPGEEPEAYAQLADLVPRIAHLQPPHGCARIHLLRDSPNHRQAAERGFARVRPYASYAHAFGDYERLSDQAYLFQYDYADGRDPRAYTGDIDEQAQRWIRVKRRPSPLSPRCEIFVLGRHRLLFDSRRRDRAGSSLPRLRRVKDDAWALLQAVESPIPRARLEREWSRAVPLAPLLERLLAERWAYEADGRIVRLVVIRQDPSPIAEARRIIRRKLRELSRTWRRRFG